MTDQHWDPATDPFQPAIPRAGEPGRLALHTPLRPGWPCRHCHRPLNPVSHMRTGRPTIGVSCANCDRPWGVTPP